MPRRLLIGFAASWLLVGCSSDRLSEELVETTTARIAGHTGAADVQLSVEDVECAARHLDDEEARSMEEEPLGTAAASVLSTAIIDCVGVDALAGSALAPLVESASETSLACATERLGDGIVDLLADRLTGEDAPRAELELRVATALALCLEPDELLNQIAEPN